ncbi:MAG: hypothetical protein K0Q52_71 [Microbacterium sp.]|jgi:MinD-like ATPase involved in chromosome partitioning or flagellar assembly|nr:hypothetical protein [Microbacterium sp.]
MTLAALPRTFATVTGTTARFTAADGHTEHLTPNEPGIDIRQTVIRRATDEARRNGSAIELVTRGDRGEHRLLVLPDGTLTTAPEPNMDETTDGLEKSTQRSVRAAEAAAPALHPATEQPISRPDAEPAERASFIATPRATVSADSSWRRAVAALGVQVKPSPAETARQNRDRIVSRHWAGCRTIAVVNGKGGVGKTVTTAMLAAVYGRRGGGNVLAWDNNDTRGTLGWRTESGLYDTTIRDLLPAADRLLGPSSAISDITRFVHHQSADRYDVLRSNPELLAADQRVTLREFDTLMRIAARYFRLVIFDSGNDESADRWLRMIDSSYQLVIPTLTTPESAESAALLLDALRNRDHRSATLARNAVVIVTASEAGLHAALARIAAGFQPHVRSVVTIPYDPALKAGPVRFDHLRPRTRDAWVTAAAAAAEVL